MPKDLSKMFACGKQITVGIAGPSANLSPRFDGRLLAIGGNDYGQPFGADR